MKIHTITHKTARVNGKPVKTYKIRYEEVVRDPATGLPVMTPEGRSQKRSRSETYPTFDAADTRRREIEAERAATGSVTGREARLEPFAVFAAGWLQSLDIRVQRGKLKTRTRDEYARIVATYLLPQFGSTAIGAVSPERIEEFAAGLLDGRSAATFDRIWHVFGRVLKYAVRKKAIPANPLDATELDAGHATGDAEDFAPHPLTGPQVAAVAAHIGKEKQQPVYALAVLFLAYTGLRAAEFAGLEIGDLTLDGPAPSLRVVRTKRRVGGEWVVGTPKSRKSRRTVPIEPWLADDLRAHLAAHPRRDDPTAPVFPNRANGGRHPRPLNWSDPAAPQQLYENLLKPALRAAGLPVTAPATATGPAVRGVRLHDLRHTFAVLSLSAGEHYMMVSKWLGHANYTITLNVYGDYIPETEGGKAAPLARPSAPAASADNVVQFRRRQA